MTLADDLAGHSTVSYTITIFAFNQEEMNITLKGSEKVHV